jgi:hypothetical protein
MRGFEQERTFLTLCVLDNRYTRDEGRSEAYRVCNF